MHVHRYLKAKLQQRRCKTAALDGINKRNFLSRQPMQQHVEPSVIRLSSRTQHNERTSKQRATHRIAQETCAAVLRLFLPSRLTVQKWFQVL